MNYSELLPPLQRLCIETGSFIREHFGKVEDADIETKEKNSLVSFVDKEAEKRLIFSLKEMIPEAGFLTEEDTVENSDQSYVWIVDPLDGTTNYISGIPQFSISIALKYNKNVELGVVYDVMHDTFFQAVKGKGAFQNNKSIRVSTTSKLDDSLIATGFPYDKSKIDWKLLHTLNHYIKQARGVRRLGSASLDLCLLANGTFDLYYERSLNPWDIAAGLLIVQESGGSVSDFDGNNSCLDKGEIIAYCKGMKEEAMWIIDLFRED